VEQVPRALPEVSPLVFGESGTSLPKGWGGGLCVGVSFVEVGVGGGSERSDAGI